MKRLAAVAALLVACGGGGGKADGGFPETLEITRFYPQSPTNQSMVVVYGKLTEPATGTVHVTDGCATELAAVAASDFDSLGVVVDLEPNHVYAMQAYLETDDGRRSPCSSPVPFVSDDTPPVAPTITSIDGGGQELKVFGTATEVGTVDLYGSADCSGEVVGSGPIYDRVFEVDFISHLGLTPYSITLTDLAGNASPCSNSITASAGNWVILFGSGYVNGHTLVVEGTAPVGDVIDLFDDAHCTHLVGSGTSNGSFDIQVTIPSGQTQISGVDETFDSMACETSNIMAVAFPDPPVVGSNPLSPNASRTPSIIGTAEPGAEIELSTTACGAAFATGTADATGAFSIPVTVSGGSLTIHAIQIVTNPPDWYYDSSCYAGSFTYVVDDVAPSLVGSVTPTSPASTTAATFTFSTDTGATIAVFAGASCSGTPIATGISAISLPETVATNATTSFSGIATDTAGNTSACVDATYVEDEVAPATPSIAGSSPASPSSARRPFVKASSEPGATILLFNDADCSGASTSALAGTDGSASVQVAALPLGDSQLSVEAVDAAGNVSGCSAPLAYTALPGAAARDVDSDGVDDLIAGEPGVPQTIVFSGRTLASIASYAGARGDAVAILGDVNGDGFADTIVGETGTTSGRARVFSGIDDSLLYERDGRNDGGQLGASVAAIGDVDADGRADFVVGSPIAGLVFVYRGSDGLLIANVPTIDALAIGVGGDVDGDLGDDLLTADAGTLAGSNIAVVRAGFDGRELARLAGSQPDDAFAAASAIVPDLDGDGLADVIVGAPWQDIGGGAPPGKVYAFTGAGTPVWTASGTIVDEHFGAIVRGAGDLDGDGVGDVLVASREQLAGGLSSGAVTALAGAGGSVLWRRELDAMGAMASTTDLDGDGLRDVAVGQPSDNTIVILSGKDGTPIETLTAPSLGSSIGGEP